MASMEKYKGKYRTDSNRLKGWNYANTVLYFITIVTQNRECNLGTHPHEHPAHHPKRQPKSMSSYIAGYKSAVNSKINDFIDGNNLNMPKYNRNNHFFQNNYYNHIIRNNTSYQNIKNYIIQNPMKWQNDSFNPTNPKSDI